MKLCFVSVNGPRETYFVDEPRTILAQNEKSRQLFIITTNTKFHEILLFWGSSWACFVKPLTAGVPMLNANVTPLSVVHMKIWEVLVTNICQGCNCRLPQSLYSDS
jgi:hypothetical protein